MCFGGGGGKAKSVANTPAYAPEDAYTAHHVTAEDEDGTVRTLPIVPEDERPKTSVPQVTHTNDTIRM